ncbi:MAG: bifunctional aldolase/short-chain dehydrogenase [Acidobacteria bacterium]|nr:bifunctional aldolase/short-chain dehydrogenase [Acidobacteriota bacterium]
MQSRWDDADANACIARHAGRWGGDLALRAYAAALIGSEESLVLHGGGNCSVKTAVRNVFGETVPVLFVKPSGYNLAAVEPESYCGLDLAYLRRLRELPDMSDELMVNELMTHLLNHRSATPSIETLVHAFLPGKFIDHTHPDAILALTNQTAGRAVVQEALGEEVIVLDYVKPGFSLARTAAQAYEASPGCRAMVWMHHGLTSWGESARESYEITVDLVSRAERFLSGRVSRPLVSARQTSLADAEARMEKAAPVIRGVLAQRTGDPDRPYAPVILEPLVTREILDLLDSEHGRTIALSPPLTSDHLIRIRRTPLWIDITDFEHLPKLREQVSAALQAYTREYGAYVERHASRQPEGTGRLDSYPRVVLVPGLGALCAGCDSAAAGIAKDITLHTLTTKLKIFAMEGDYQSLSEEDLFDMEYRALQHAKLRDNAHLQLGGRVAIVTGAAGAIGSGICEGLLENGCHVALTDLAVDRLEDLGRQLRERFPGRVIELAMDVTDPQSVRSAFRRVIATWGGVDLVVPNAGAALVSPLADMDLEAFRRLERINTEGTLLVLAEAGRHFRLQGTGGDIVVVSTKNVFAPGAGFGAYSATKSAAHQLARIASLEFAELGVRVNMVSPDAVFAHGERRSGLWAEVGPDRMKARGLDAAGLEEYYRSRNLLKARVTARHVANAVVFFATRQTPTTGATLPIDGGLPDSTPR